VVLTGEADRAFPALCRRLLAGDPPGAKVQAAPVPDLADVALPYDEYDDHDLAHRILYVEASRGCPFECEFCLSSLDVPVRAFPLDPFLAALTRLLDRGARQFKFVDRTFNLNLRTSRAILEFFLRRPEPGLFLHFELVPDRLPPELREVIAAFPPGVLQFEVGIQTFNPEVAARIRRRQDYSRLEANLRWLRGATGVHLHTDLIFGLPGETLASFAAGFDRLLALGPHEIQVGILKRLRGTPLTQHEAEWAMVFSPVPPYEILANRDVDFGTLQRIRRFARFWDLVANSGRFPCTAPQLWAGADSPFAAFLRFSDWLYEQAGRQHAIALPRLAGFLAEYLIGPGGRPRDEVTRALELDLGPRREAGRPVGRGADQRQRRHRNHPAGAIPPPASEPAAAGVGPNSPPPGDGCQPPRAGVHPTADTTPDNPPVSHPSPP
jgi:hypothetical protein